MSGFYLAGAAATAASSGASASSFAFTDPDVVPRTVQYAFDVVGHAYSFPGQLATILAGKPLVIFTGDVVFDGCTDWPKFDAMVENITEWYLTPGNHDKDILCPENVDPAAKLFETFMRNGDQFILMDTVENAWTFSASQMQQLTDAFAQPARNRFIFWHDAVHWEDPAIGGAGTPERDWLPNSFDNYTADTNQLAQFAAETRPILESQPNVTVFFGNYGNRDAPFGYHDETLNGVRYIGAGVSARDGAVNSAYNTVSVFDDGTIDIARIPLLCDIPSDQRARPLVCE